MKQIVHFSPPCHLQDPQCSREFPLGMGVPGWAQTEQGTRAAPRCHHAFLGRFGWKRDSPKVTRSRNVQPNPGIEEKRGKSPIFSKQREIRKENFPQLELSAQSSEAMSVLLC